MSIGKSIFRVGFELSPIILVNGLASSIPGSMLPIIALTQAADFTLDLLNGTDPLDPNQFFAHFRPMPGGTLVDNELGDYPFANQAVAANAIIAKPLQVSLLMLCPANQAAGYTGKLATFSALKSALDAHNQAGGTYIVATPAHVYTNCILVALRDVSGGQTQQPQHAWQWDFVQPLLTQGQADTAYNALMQKIAGGLPINGQPTWSGLATSVGNTISSTASTIVRDAQNLVGAAVSGVASSLGQ